MLCHPQICDNGALLYCCQLLLIVTVWYFAGMTLSVKCVQCSSWNRGSTISSKRLKLLSSTTPKGSKPWQIKSAVALTNRLCFMLSCGNRIDLSTIPGNDCYINDDCFAVSKTLSTGLSPLSSRNSTTFCEWTRCR